MSKTKMVAGGGRKSPERVEVPDPHPQLHPAVQHEGEVQPCKDPWHRSTRPGMEAWEKLPAALKGGGAGGE